MVIIICKKYTELDDEVTYKNKMILSSDILSREKKKKLSASCYRTIKIANTSTELTSLIYHYVILPYCEIICLNFIIGVI